MRLAQAKLLASSTTTDTILRISISIPTTQKSHDSFRCSSSNQSQALALVARKFETLGLNFSYETRTSEAASVVSYNRYYHGSPLNKNSTQNLSLGREKAWTYFTGSFAVNCNLIIEDSS